jgi:hypothetical protein
LKRLGGQLAGKGAGSCVSRRGSHSQHSRAAVRELCTGVCRKAAQLRWEAGAWSRSGVGLQKGGDGPCLRSGRSLKGT